MRAHPKLCSVTKASFAWRVRKKASLASVNSFAVIRSREKGAQTLIFLEDVNRKQLHFSSTMKWPRP